MMQAEFNKLSKQERIDLVWDKLMNIIPFKEDNPYLNVRHVYARLSEHEEWRKVREDRTQSDFIGNMMSKYFKHSLRLILNGNNKGFAIAMNRENFDILNIDDIPDKFLEECYCTEISKGREDTEYLDYFDSTLHLFPQKVYELSKCIPMGMSEYIQLSKEVGRWATKLDYTAHKLQDIAENTGDSIDKIVESYGKRKQKIKYNIITGLSILAIIGILAMLYLLK